MNWFINGLYNLCISLHHCLTFVPYYMKDGIKNSEISVRDPLWKKVKWIPSINAFAIQLFSNCSIHIANMFKQSFTFCLNTAAPIFMTTCCSLFPVCFFMASGVRAFSVRLIFSMICMTWSCSTLMHACKEPLSSVTLKCIVNLLKHTKYAFMLYVLSKCICYNDAVTQLLLWWELETAVK